MGGRFERAGLVFDVLTAVPVWLVTPLVRPWHLRWGATSTEVTASMPGDDVVPRAQFTATRAITINARPAVVWPWIAQMGPAPRGGAYTYDWIENLLGLNMHSAEVVLDEFQNPRPGDQILYGGNVMTVELAERPHCLAWRSSDGNWVWLFSLRETEGRTRLISHNRFRLPGLKAATRPA